MNGLVSGVECYKVVFERQNIEWVCLRLVFFMVQKGIVIISVVILMILIFA